MFKLSIDYYVLVYEEELLYRRDERVIKKTVSTVVHDVYLVIM